MALKYDPYNYLNTQQLKYSKEYSTKELERAYSYLRGIALKRMARLEQAGFVTGGQYQRLKALGLPRIKEVRNRNELVMYLQQIAFFTTLEQSTVTGIKRIRKQRLAQFQAAGFAITENEFDDFIDFFESVKNVSGKYYTIELAADVYNWAARERVSPKRIVADYYKIARKLGRIEGGKK